MMFVTVGTGPRGFDRLVRCIDDIATEYDEPFRAQIGCGNYIPQNLEWSRFIDEKDIHELYEAATVVIGHAGAGTLLDALSHEKPVVILPRQGRLDEANDDHQRELATALADHPAVFPAWDTDELPTTLEQARQQSDGLRERDDSLYRFLVNYIDNI